MLASAIVLAYGEEPWLDACVASLLTSRGVDVEVVVVDNGCTTPDVIRRVRERGVAVVSPGLNLGFAGGCNLGASASRGEVIALVNSDAAVAPDALLGLARAATRPEVGIATASIRLADRPAILNSAGNPIHFLGLSWSGSFGEPADRYPTEREVLGASGAGLAMRREVWERLGGFEERLFAYHEDVDLSLRCWLAGLRVVWVPDAIVYHHYEFTRNAEKYYLLERNRLVLLLTLLEGRTLALIAPALLAFELGIAAVSIKAGWWRQKLQGWAWLVRNRHWLRERRRVMQACRVVRDREIARRFVGRFTAANLPQPAALRPVDWALGKYWQLVRRWA